MPPYLFKVLATHTNFSLQTVENKPNKVLDTANKKRYATKMPSVCQREGCNEFINRPTAKRTPIYCSVKCNNKVTIARFAARHPERYAARHPPHKIPPAPITLSCQYEKCGKDFETAPNHFPIQKYCGDDCQVRARYFRRKGRHLGETSLLDEIACQDCEKSFRPTRRHQVLCGDGCRQEAAKKKYARREAARNERLPHLRRTYHLLNRYGITLEEKDKMFADQGSCCANRGCLSTYSGTGANAQFHVDHDHDSGKIRGVLCAFCNRSLGCINDCIYKLRGLLVYIEENISTRQISFPTSKGAAKLKVKLLAEQGGCCANPNCQVSDAWQYHLDHDHDSGFVREVLCRGCNLALGMMKESYERIYGLIDYLESHAEPEVLPVYPALAAGGLICRAKRSPSFGRSWRQATLHGTSGSRSSPLGEP